MAPRVSGCDKKMDPSARLGGDNETCSLRYLFEKHVEATEKTPGVHMNVGLELGKECLESRDSWRTCERLDSMRTKETKARIYDIHV